MARRRYGFRIAASFEQIDGSAKEFLEPEEESEIGIGVLNRRHRSEDDKEVDVASRGIEISASCRSEEHQRGNSEPRRKAGNIRLPLRDPVGKLVGHGLILRWA